MFERIRLVKCLKKFRLYLLYTTNDLKIPALKQKLILFSVARPVSSAPEKLPDPSFRHLCKPGNFRHRNLLLSQRDNEFVPFTMMIL